MDWEYEVIQDRTLTGLRADLDAHTRAGWELISVTSHEGELLAFIRKPPPPIPPTGEQPARVK
jgi:hypothetical protein